MEHRNGVHKYRPYLQAEAIITGQTLQSTEKPVLLYK